jgi:hypothetical protein
LRSRLICGVSEVREVTYYGEIELLLADGASCDRRVRVRVIKDIIYIHPNMSYLLYYYLVTNYNQLEASD